MAQAAIGSRRRVLPGRVLFGSKTSRLALLLLLLVGAAILIAPWFEEPLRREMEARLNRELTGYTVALPRLDIHPLSASLTLGDLSVRQDAHPKPPVLEVRALHAGVHWRALLSLRLVADFVFDEPRVHVDLRQLSAEANDNVAVQDKGWQAALESIYPLKINELNVRDGTLTYIDDAGQPLAVTQLALLATNIRNIRSPNDTFPSPLHLDAKVLEGGSLRLDGAANFLAEPQPNVRAEIELKGIPLKRLAPVAQDANLHISGGTLSALGQVESTDKHRSARLARAEIDNIAVDYVHSAPTAAAEARRAALVSDTAADIAKQPDMTVDIDQLRIKNGSLGYVDQSAKPPFRVFLDKSQIEVRDISTRPNAPRGRVMASGQLMGAGPSSAWISFMPRQHDPVLDLAVQIEKTPLKSLNDVLQAEGNFDVTAGEFAFYSELHVADGAINGYVKPLFTDIDVYNRAQDKHDPLLHQVYEGMVGGLATLLENRSDAVATQATVRGSTESPTLSTWQVFLNLVRNAFFKAILPGFNHARGEDSAPPAP